MRNSFSMMPYGRCCFLFLVALLIGGTCPVDAQPNNPIPEQPPMACPTAEAFAQVAVTRVFAKPDSGGTPRAELDKEIVVEVAKLQTLIDKAKCASPKKKIFLFLDGRPVKDVTPFPPTDPAKPFLTFPLKRAESSRETWTHILGQPRWEPRPTSVSVGLEDEYAVESKASILLDVIPHGWFALWAGLFAVILIAFLVLVIRSDVLRDSGPQPGHLARKPYSLARVQAAWWFFLVLAAYLFIGIITGDFSTTITGTVLGLLGISAATVVGAATIDAGKATTPVPPAPAGNVVGAPPPIPALLAPAVATNRYWWIDILSDANGVSFHRFQIAVWTFVLGIIFVVQVYKVLAMPTFDGTLLALLGISAGTYLGLKVPEPK